MHLDSLNSLTTDTETFNYEFEIYKKDYKLKCYLEKLFDSKYQVVWTTRPVKVKPYGVCSWDSSNIIIMKQNGSFAMLSNSEWGEFRQLT